MAKAALKKKGPKLTLVPPLPDKARIELLRKKVDGDLGVDLSNEQKRLRVYRTGCDALDVAIGRIDPYIMNGGVPERSIIEIFGENGVYKSGTLEQLIVSVQKRGLWAVVCYTEEPDYARMERIGVDMSRLIILDCYKQSKERKSKSMFAETRLEDLLIAAGCEEVGLIGIDSLKSLTSVLSYFEKGDSKKGAMKSFEDTEVATRARLMEKFFDKLKQRKNDHVITVFVNQMNEHIPTREQQMNRQPGEESRPKTSGGRRKEFECILRIQVKSKPLKSKIPHAELGTTNQPMEGYRPQYGLRVFYKLWKNKYSNFTGLRIVASNFIFDKQGFSNVEDIVTMAAYLGIIERKTNYWYWTYKGKTRKWNGKPACVEAFENAPRAYQKLYQAVVKQSEKLFAYKFDEKLKTEHVLDQAVSDKRITEALKVR